MLTRIVVVVSIFAALAACGQKEAAPAASAEPAVQAAPEAAEPAAQVVYDETLDYFGVSFHVVATGAGSIGSVTITPSGLESDNSAIIRETDGRVTLAEVNDLDADGSPEIYVYTQSAGSGSYGGLIAYAANDRKSLSEIYLPPVAENPEVSQGYMGHDEFRVGEGALVQRFPVYREGDTNAEPTGGMRQLQYKLAKGEAGWVLRVDRVVEY
jgi:predicted small lipoprotein YifL